MGVLAQSSSAKGVLLSGIISRACKGASPFRAIPNNDQMYGAKSGDFGALYAILLQSFIENIQGLQCIVLRMAPWKSGGGSAQVIPTTRDP